MNDKLDKYIRYPLRVFNNKYVLYIAIYSLLIMFILLSIANITSFFFEELFNQYKPHYDFIKYSLYQFIEISVLGYFVSKYKFCYWSLFSFYGIVYMRIVWFIHKQIIEITDFGLYINLGVVTSLLACTIVFFIKEPTLKLFKNENETNKNRDKI